jgi:toxin FitB
MYLLDTNVVSELRKGSRANERVRSWLTDVADEHLRQGIERVRARDAVQAEHLERWFRRLVADYACSPWMRAWPSCGVDSTCPIPSPPSMVCSQPPPSCMASPSSRANVRDVERTGARLLNPFEA